MNIYERIQQLRKSKGLSQEQLADRLGVSRQAVSKWESRQSLPDIDKIIAISDYFGVSCDWLLKGEETAFPQQAQQPPEKKTVNKQRVMITATCLNIVGLVRMWALWREWQNMPALAIGFVFMLAGFFVIGMGATFMDQPDKDIVVYQWLKKIIWLDALPSTFFMWRFVVPMIYNSWYFSWVSGIAAIVGTYLAICLAVTYFANRKIEQAQTE